MLMLGHSAIGISIGLATGNPWLAFAAGVVSHHIADQIPHFDAGSLWPEEERHDNDAIHTFHRLDWISVIIDGLLTLGLLIWLLPNVPHDHLIAVLAGVLGANTPDFVHNVPFWNKQLLRFGWIKKWRDEIHFRFHWTVDAKNWFWGVLTQAIFIGIAIGLVLR